MRDTDYTISLTNTYFAVGQVPGVGTSKTTSDFVVDYVNAETYGYVYWEVKGYIANESESEGE